MTKFVNLLKNNWRKLVTAVFVFLIFTMPSSRGILAKIFYFSAEAGVKHYHQNKMDSTTGHGTVSCPSSQSTASPCSDTHSKSSG